MSHESKAPAQPWSLPPEIPEVDEWNGVLHTGDIAMFDEDGYVTISGRKNRYIKIAGHRMSTCSIHPGTARLRFQMLNLGFRAVP